MKKLILGLLVSAHCLGAHGQGTVHFNNRVVPIIDAKFFAPGGTVGFGAGYSAQIFAGPEGTAIASLKPVYPATTFRTGNAAGYVVPIDVVIPGVLPGEKATMVVRVFCGDSPETARGAGAVGNFISITLGGGLLPPANMIGLQSFTTAGPICHPIPEPTPFVLSLFGALAVFLFRPPRGNRSNDPRARGAGMKKVVLGTAVCAHCLGAHGQGTVQFNNRATADGVDAKVVMPGGTVGLGAGFSAQIFAGPKGTPSGSLQPVYPATTFRTGIAAGYVVPIVVVIPGVLPGEKATMVVRVFCGDVFEKSLGYATSAPITITLGGGPLPPANMVGLQSFIGEAPCLPEPSTFILGLLGALGLFSVRRSFR